MFDVLRTLFLEHGYAAVFGVLLLCGLGLPIPEEFTLIGAGVVVYTGQAALVPMILVTIAGILVGDSFLFWLGRRYGPTLLQRKLFRRILHAERMSKVREQFDKHGVKAVFFARFLAGIRPCVYFTAGTLGMRLRSFLLLDLLGALLSAPISVWLGFHFGGEIERAFKMLGRVDVVLMSAAGAVAAWLLVRWAWQRRRRAEPARSA